MRKLYVIDNRPGQAAPAAYLANAHTIALGPPTPRANPIKGEPHESTVRAVGPQRAQRRGVGGDTRQFPGEPRWLRRGVHLPVGRGDDDGNDGVRYDLSPGSVLFTPAGFTGRWDVSETFRKVYCIIKR